MFKKIFYETILCCILFLAAVPCFADIDPILLDKPNNIVFECSPRIFIEVPSYAMIDTTTSGRHADNYFLFLKAEVLYLEEDEWDGFDKDSFAARYTDILDNTTDYPLNYMMTSMQTLKNGWQTLSEPVPYATLRYLYLVFDVSRTNRNGWSLVFRPAERGGESVCEIEVPIKVQ